MTVKNNLRLSAPENIILQFFICIVFIISFGSIALLLGQDVNGDLLNYHFYDGFAMLHPRLGHDVAPALMQTYLNPFFDSINYLLIILQKPMLTSFILGAVSGAIGFFLYQISRLLFAGLATEERVIYTIFAIAIGMTGAAGISLTGTTTNDTKMTLMVIGSLYCLLKAGDASLKSQTYYIALAGFIAGLVLAFKLIAACYVIGLGVALWFSSLRKTRVFSVFVVLGFLLANGYWMLVLYNNFQSPLFPLYNNIFHSPYAPYISFNLPTSTIKHEIMDYLLLPFNIGRSENTLFAEAKMQDMRTALIFLLALVFAGKYLFNKSLTANQNEKTSWQLLITFFITSYIIWLVVLTNYRYMLPLEIISGLMIIYFARKIFHSEFACQIFLALLVLLLGVTTYYPDWGRITFGKEYFAMTPPVLPDNAKVILATQPLAYVIPFFPHSIRFIGMPFVQLGVNSNGEQGVPRKLFSDVMRELIKERNTTPLYTLAFQKIDNNTVRSIANLGRYGLIQDQTRCVNFETNIGNKLQLCPLLLPL